MPIYHLYSWRKKRAEEGEPDVYQYEYVPEKLRTQVVFILRAGLGPFKIYRRSDTRFNESWPLIKGILCRELGIFYLSDERADPAEDCIGAVLQWTDVDHWLDVVEVCSVRIYEMRDWEPSARRDQGITQPPKEAIEELNFRFRDAGFGYQFEAGQITRVDSQLLHAEVVRPTLSLLGDPRFAGVQEEFLSAHAHYRAGEHEDAIVDANRAFESTMKTICDIKDWGHPSGARASDLIKIIRKNGLLPDYLDSSFDQLIATLKSGLPQVRNEAGGHGQGAARRATPSYVAGYAPHLAAANIVLLVEALKATE